MSTRVAFNSGEFSPEMAYRSDIDQHDRACETLENWEISQMGGLRRRRGMRQIATAVSKESRLVPFIYSYDYGENTRFVVEVSEHVVRVISLDGSELARFESSTECPFLFHAGQFRYFQINKLLLITSENNPPMALEYDGDAEWTFTEWEFKNKPWRYVSEQRDWPIEVEVSSSVEEDGKEVQYGNVTFPAEVPEGETPEALEGEDFLRVSFWNDTYQVLSKRNDILGVTNGVPSVRAFTSSTTSGKRYQKFSIEKDDGIKYWVCLQAWKKSYAMKGVFSPANYPNMFAETSKVDNVAITTSVEFLSDMAAGTVFGISNTYYEYYTCIKDFDASSGISSPATSPGYFIKGLMVGGAVPCQGKWSFVCSGRWIGEYEVRRNYENYDFSSEWESRGTSFSRIDALSNTIITGTEQDEACWLRLFLTKSQKIITSDYLTGFPPDGCGNKLVVDGYKHDMTFRVTREEENGEQVIKYRNEGPLFVYWKGKRPIYDWSWAAFSSRTGYPLLSAIYNNRLVFASTQEQPQTVWMSRTDDLNNFATSGSAATAALALTMNTTSQNPICWLHPQSYRLMLGTSEAEYSISAGQSRAGISNANAQIEDHSHVGSDGIAVLALNDTALFVERGAGRVYSLQYSFQIDGYTAQDISVFAPHIASEHGGITEMSSIRKPDTVALFVLGDGQLGLCTYNTFHEINAWHRWVTNGRILSVCGMPDGVNDDKIYLVVERGNGEVYIELIDDNSDYTDAGQDYASTLITMPMIDYREGFFGKRSSEPSYLCLGAEFTMKDDNILVSDDGGQTWLRPPNRGDFKLQKGWNKQYTPSGYKYEVRPAVKITGNQGIHILGLRN